MIVLVVMKVIVVMIDWVESCDMLYMLCLLVYLELKVVLMLVRKLLIVSSRGEDGMVIWGSCLVVLSIISGFVIILVIKVLC